MLLVNGLFYIYTSGTYTGMMINEPRHEKTGFLHKGKQRRISASR